LDQFERKPFGTKTTKIKRDDCLHRNDPDPPWDFENYSAGGTKKGADPHYAVMSLDEIKALPVGQAADERRLQKVRKCGPLTILRQSKAECVDARRVSPALIFATPRRNRRRGRARAAGLSSSTHSARVKSIAFGLTERSPSRSAGNIPTSAWTDGHCDPPYKPNFSQSGSRPVGTNGMKKTKIK
jgi:hypothetical protein